MYQTFKRSPEAFTKPFGYHDNSENYSENTFSSILPASVIQPNIHFAVERGDKSSKLTNVKVGASNSLI
ncbi:M66 family metalloprotease, partial [Pseudoalteromonas sp. S4389]|uniref:M66 family metalloprotease n=1 Tax=Pseudoalteromonas sp. S4389 TaxID=579556 RepID=UPI001BB1CF53